MLMTTGAEYGLISWSETAELQQHRAQRPRFSRRTFALGSLSVAVGLAAVLSSNRIAFAQQLKAGVTPLGFGGIENDSTSNTGGYGLVINPEVTKGLISAAVNPGMIRAIADRQIDQKNNVRVETRLWKVAGEPELDREDLAKMMLYADTYGVTLMMGDLNRPKVKVETVIGGMADIQELHVLGYRWREGIITPEQIYMLDRSTNLINSRHLITLDPEV